MDSFEQFDQKGYEKEIDRYILTDNGIQETNNPNSTIVKWTKRLNLYKRPLSYNLM